jgi:hypothetical protein
MLINVQIIDINKAGGQATAHTILPKPRLPISRHYVQRPHIQDLLTEKLLPSSPSGMQPRCVLHGLAGTGKTQLASWWIEANKDR